MLDIHQDTPFPLLSFDLDPEAYQSAFFKGATDLSLPTSKDEKALTFFDSNLRHQQTTSESDNLPPDVLEIYDQLNELKVTP